MKYTFLIASFMIIGFTNLMAQPINEPTYWMKVAKAAELEDNNDYYNALDMYEECYRESKEDTLVRHIAMMQYKLRDYKRAEKWFERAIEKDEAIDHPELRLYYGQVLRINEEYQKAFDVLNDYIPFATNDSFSVMAENELIGMENMSKAVKPLDLFVTAVPTPVNTGLTDQSPARHPDGSLYYSSFNKRSKIVIGADGQLKTNSNSKKKGGNKSKGRSNPNRGKDYHFKIFQSQKDKDDEWDKPDKLKTAINREDFHTGNVSFTKDGNRMYFTRAKIEGDKVVESKIYTSEWDGDKWTGARACGGINGDWIATHPVVGELFGNEVIYFTSDMDGGYGGTDIYYANGSGVDFELPVNLGNVINSWGNEVTPYYQEGVLYFASDAYPGAGGLDIYQSNWDGTRWSAPKNMGPGYNSAYDDYGLNFYDRDKKGYLVSNRPYEGKKSSKSVTCCDDIFNVEIQEIEIKVIVSTFDEEGNPVNNVVGKVRELKRSSKPIVDRLNSGDESNRLDIGLQVDKAFVVILEADGYKTDSFEMNTVGYVTSRTFNQDVVLKPLEPETEIVTINEAIRLNNIYYDLDDDRILPEAEPDLEFLFGLLNQYPTMVIELSSHTDSRSSDPYNQDLSQRRANSAKRWLVNKGINPQRVNAVGYGESQILNRCTNGVDCTEAEHRLNRRTEFKIISGPTSIEIQKEVIKPRKN